MASKLQLSELVESWFHVSSDQFAMENLAYAIGQAVFLRTDTPDFAEETIAFKTLEEMVRICSQAQPNLTLEKIIVYAMADGEPSALTLGFISATKGQRPCNLESVLG